MRRLLAAAATVGLVIASTAGTLADPAGPGADTDSADPGVGVDTSDSEDPLARRDEAVALVIAQDPRFAEVPDFERQAALANSNFDPAMLLASDYYRVLPTLASTISAWMYDLGYRPNHLVEVTLVRGCAALPNSEGPSSETAPLPDPCEWRHSWFYRVEPDDSVTFLFEEGHPDPMPAE